MTTARTRCDFTSCTRYARPGSHRCTAHKTAVDRAPGPLSEIERTVASKDYGKYQHLMLQAAADDDGIDNEIGILRTVLARLLSEEDDPSRLAAGVAKISSTIIVAMKAKRSLSGQAADDFTDAVALILEELQS